MRWKSTHILLLIVGFALSAMSPLGSARADEAWQSFLTVSPRGGESSSNKRGGGLMRTSSLSRSSSKTVTQNMKWLAEVRYRGKTRPQKAELHVFYVGYRGESTKPFILKSETHVLELSEGGKASLELVSPTTRLTKNRTRTTGSGSRGFTKSKSTVRGERVVGCVVQLLSDGTVERVWTSNSSWAKVAWENPLTDAALSRKLKNALN